MGEFIYVFDPARKDELLKAGFVLLKSDEKNRVFIFKADNSIAFALDNTSCVYSNIFTF